MDRRAFFNGLVLGSALGGLWSALVVICLAFACMDGGGNFGWIGWSWTIATAACAAVCGFAMGVLTP